MEKVFLAVQNRKISRLRRALINTVITRSSRARHGGPAGVAGHSNVAHSSHLYPTSTPGWHVKTRVCPPLVAPISPSPRSVPRSFSTETSLLVPSHDAPRMLEPWRVAHSSNHSPTRPHENRPTCPQDTLESYHAISAGSSKMPLRGE